MSKRIDELAAMAGYDPQWSTKADREANFDYQEFAELLLKDCGKLISNQYQGRIPFEVRLSLLNLKTYFDLTS
jgi:hypothetical protein